MLRSRSAAEARMLHVEWQAGDLTSAYVPLRVAEAAAPVRRQSGLIRSSPSRTSRPTSTRRPSSSSRPGRSLGPERLIRLEQELEVVAQERRQGQLAPLERAAGRPCRCLRRSAITVRRRSSAVDVELVERAQLVESVVADRAPRLHEGPPPPERHRIRSQPCRERVEQPVGRPPVRRDASPQLDLFAAASSSAARTASRQVKTLTPIVRCSEAVSEVMAWCSQPRGR